MKKILKNLLVAIGIISYFMILVFAYTRMNTERFANDIKVFAGAFLVIGIIVLEKAYKKDSGQMAITGIELLVLSFYSLSIMHMVNIFKCDFHFYLIIASIIVACYYILKGIGIFTKERKEYLKGLSDISEIVKEDEPIKKEAKKRNTPKEEIVKEIVDDDKKENVENKKEINDKKKTSTKKTTSTQKKTQAKKSTSTKKNNTDSKKVETKKTIQPEKVQTKRTTTKKTTKVEEIKTDVKPESAKKRTTTKKKETEMIAEKTKKKKTSTPATTTKKTTKKSEKEVKEND